MEVIVKPTESCNGTCVYCSAGGEPARGPVLPAERLDELFTAFAGWLRRDERRQLRFIWHGGEPLLCGPEYYAAVVREQRRVFADDAPRVRNAVQSNLSLISERWLPYLRDLLAGQAIGTSFDIVDGVRGLASGQKLAELWLRAVALLRAHGIAVGVVYVVHRGSLPRARDLYWYFRNLDPGLNVRFNPLYKEGRAAGGDAASLWVSPEQYGQFLIELCETWRADRMRFRVMPLLEWYRAWRGNYRLCCDSKGTCHESHLGINPSGDVYGCGRFSDSGTHRLGNVFADPLEAMLEARRHGELASRSAVLRAGPCRDCRYWELCHGGCPALAWLYYGDFHRETYFCAARKRVFEHFERQFGPPAHLPAGDAPKCAAGTDHG